MQCLHTITEFKFDSFDTEHSPDYFAIADYNNSLVCYWDLSYKISGVAIYDLITGNRKTDYSLTAHEFKLGKRGKIFINSFQDVILPARDIETQKIIDRCSFPPFMRSTETSQAFSVCTKDLPLVATGEYRQITKLEFGRRVRVTIGQFKIWDYETYSCLLHFEFENLILCSTNNLKNFLRESEEVKISPLVFTPSGDFLIVRYVDPQQCCLIQIWDTKNLKPSQTIKNLPRLTITSVGVRLDGTIIACGIREEQVCVWQLQSDRIIYTASEMSPCILSTDGRVLIYATASHEIVIRDLVAEKDLCKLQGHEAPLAYLALSEDRQFLASYSIDRQIKIWGIPNHS